MSFEATTYRQVFGGIDNTNNLQLLSSRTPNRSLKDVNAGNPSDLVRQADSRNLSRYLKSNEQNRPNANLQSNVTMRTHYDSGTPKSYPDFSSNSFQNNSNNQMHEGPRPYDYRHWFGNINGGGGAPTNDARRRKLMDMLENRHIYDSHDQQRRSDFLGQKTDQKSNHHNKYEYEAPQK